MARSTTPVLIGTAITFGNQWVLENQGPNVKILVAGGIAALLLAGAEEIPGVAPIAVGIAWTAVIAAFIAPVGGKPSVAQNLINYTGIG